MIAGVNEQLWIDFDLDSAVFLDYVAHWLHLNSSNKQPRNFHDGRYWTYNTLDTLHSIFPGWSRDTIRGIIRKCVKNGLLLINNFNKKKYDRTNWYSLSDLALKYYPKLAHLIQETPDNPGGVSCGDLTTPSGEIPTAIPNNLTTSSNNTITTTSESVDSHSNGNNGLKSDYCSNCALGDSSVSQDEMTTEGGTRSDYHNNRAKKESFLSMEDHNVDKKKHSTSYGRKSIQGEKRRAAELMWEMISVYREVFPDNPQPHPKLIATSLQKTLQGFIKRWPEAEPNGKALDIEAFRRYMTALRSLAPKFSLGQYETKDGNLKKNSLETFCRWNTFVKFLENQYS